MDVIVNNVNLDVKNLRSVISELDAAIEKNQQLKALCEQILAIQGGGSAAPKRRGRPPKAAGTTTTTTKPRGKRKKLGDVILSVLAKRSGPVAPKELRELVLKAGYPTKSDLKNFYVTVYNTAKKTPGVVKTKDGFSAGSTARSSKPTKTKRQASSKGKMASRKAKKRRVSGRKKVARKSRKAAKSKN